MVSRTKLSILKLASVVGFAVLLVAIFLARLNLTSDFFPHPYLFCDEGVYLYEGLRMTENSDFFPQSFLGGPANYFLPSLVTFFGLDVGAPTLLVIGRLFYSVLIPTLTAGVLFFTILIETKSKPISFAIAASYGFSPLILPVGLYWYPDSYIAVFTALVLCLLTAEHNGLITETACSRWLGIVCALGMATKATFLLITILLVLFRLRIKYTGHLANSNKQNFKSFITIFAVSTAVLYFPAFDRNLLFVRGQFTNVAVYQDGTRSIIEGLEFYGSYLLIASFVPVVLALPAILKVTRENKLVSWSLLVLVSYLGVWALQTQYLVRNVNLIAPLIFFVAATAIYRARGLLWSRYINVVLAISVTQALGASFYVIATNPSEDPRSTVVSRIGENAQIVGSGKQCSVLEESPYIQTIEDPEMLEDLDTYVFTSIDDSPFLSESDKLSWKYPVLTGVEFDRPTKWVIADYLDLDRESIPVPSSAYESEFLPGRHLDVLYLERTG